MLSFFYFIWLFNITLSHPCSLFQLSFESSLSPSTGFHDEFMKEFQSNLDMSNQLNFWVCASPQFEDPLNLWEMRGSGCLMPSLWEVYDALPSLLWSMNASKRNQLNLNVYISFSDSWIYIYPSSFAKWFPSFSHFKKIDLEFDTFHPKIRQSILLKNNRNIFWIGMKNDHIQSIPTLPSFICKYSSCGGHFRSVEHIFLHETKSPIVMSCWEKWISSGKSLKISW